MRLLLDTPYPSLNEALGGGLPDVGVSFLFGNAQSGKTTIAIDVVRLAVERGLKAAVVGWNRDPRWSQTFGLNGKVLETDPLEMARLSRSGNLYDLAVLDWDDVFQNPIGVREIWGRYAECRPVVITSRASEPQFHRYMQAVVDLSAREVLKSRETAPRSFLLETIPVPRATRWERLKGPELL